MSFLSIKGIYRKAQQYRFKYLRAYQNLKYRRNLTGREQGDTG